MWKKTLSGLLNKADEKEDEEQKEENEEQSTIYQTQTSEEEQAPVLEESTQIIKNLKNNKSGDSAVRR